MKAIPAIALALILLPLAATAAEPKSGGIHADIRQDLDEARSEVRADLAQAKTELDTENLSLNNNLQFNRKSKGKSAPTQELPPAEITPQGSLLIDKKEVATTPAQRRQLLAYRGQVIEIAKDGIDLGQRGATAALDAVGDASLFSLIAGGLTGSLERRIEATVKQQIQPGVLQICRRLPALRASQQQLAVSVPQFRPYANLEADDVENCEADIHNEFAMH